MVKITNQTNRYYTIRQREIVENNIAKGATTKNLVSALYIRRFDIFIVIINIFFNNNKYTKF